jgi:hypothetical protein
MIADHPAGLDRSEFRYARPLAVAGRRPLLVEPDGRLFAHARPGFSDLRFLDAAGRVVPWRPAPPGLAPGKVRRWAHSTHRWERPSRSLIRLDLGHRGIAFDEILVSSSTRRYERRVFILGSDDGRSYSAIRLASLRRLGSTHAPPLRASAAYRFVKLEIWNGDDAPLRDLRVRVRSDGDPIVVEGGHPGPYTALYGDRQARRPVYDFTRVPLGSLTLSEAARARLGPERPNPAFVPPPPAVDDRSYLARHQGLVTVALAVAAAAIALAGAVALRGPRG